VLDIDFDEIQCELISLDVFDIMGTNKIDILNNGTYEGHLTRYYINDKKEIVEKYI